MSRLRAAATVFAAMIAANAAAFVNAAGAAEKIVLQLHGPPQFEFAGYYAALWQGFYRDAGLEVEIRPGPDPRADSRGDAKGNQAQPAVDPVRLVTEGRVQFGTGTAQLVIRAAQGQPLLLLAPIFQQSGAMVYYRSDGDFASPAALANAKVGRLPASDILDIELATALVAEGVDPAKLKAVPLEPAQAFAALADRSVDAVVGSAWDLPWLAHQKGLALKSFNPADYRVEFYGDTLFTLQRLAKTAPQMVQHFYAASLKGWDYALQHPDEIASRLLTLPHPAGIADAAGFARYQAAVAHTLARYPQVQLGHSNPDRWQHIEDSLIASGALLRSADIADFIYDPDAAARNRNDLRAFAILGGALLAGLAVIAWLAWRWRRRSPPLFGAGRQPAAMAVAAPPPPIPAPASASARPAAPPVPPPPAPTPQPVPPQPPAPPPAADLNALVARLEHTIRQRVPRRIAVRLSLLPELWRCRAEPPAVRTLVLDLVTAASADIAGAGELVVGTRNYAFDNARVAETPGAQLGDYVRITVRDSGKGLDEAALDRIFDALRSPRPAAAAAAEAMRKIGGFARVESAEGIGTAVHLYFPRAAGSGEGVLKTASEAAD
ncbi:MAG: ABC transporter substrate-binding protein [Thiohalocapsa sp.]